MPVMDLSDVQGNILRSYNMVFLRLLLLSIDSAEAARKFIKSLTDGDADSCPQITPAATWNVKPVIALNIGITFHGLEAIGIPGQSLASFPPEFRSPMTERAPRLGDLDESAPENWIDGLACSVGRPSGLHIVLLLHAQDSASLEAATTSLRAQFTVNGACHELSHIDGAELPESRVHFGYVDGIAQPRIEGSGAADPGDDQPTIPIGEFLLGYPGLNGATYPMPQPRDLGLNGVFLALRIYKQDVDGFEKFLEDSARLTSCPSGVDPKEFIAAKLCGRWRNGLPLSLSPETDRPDPPIPFELWNKFDYMPGEQFQDVLPDRIGVRCPIGSHIRRNNPRSGVVAGGGGHNHRLIRRGIPYGPVFDPRNPNDGLDRGLIGLFFCGSLSNQFEFLLTEWINGDSFGLRGDLDPLLGNNDPGTSRFTLPESDNPPKVTGLKGFGRFVVTRGSAYCFIPSFTALKYLVGQTGTAQRGG